VKEEKNGIIWDMVKKEVVTSATKESDARGSRVKAAKGREERPSFWGLQEFLSEIKLFAIMRKVEPGSTDFLALRDLSEKLSSGNKEERIKSKETVDKLSAKFKESSEEARQKPLGAILSEIIPDYSAKTTLNGLVEAVNKSNAEINEAVAAGKEISPDKLIQFEGQLKDVAGELGFKENTRDGFRQMHETLISAIELSELRRHITAPTVYESPIKKKAAVFVAGDVDKAKDDGKRIQMRHWKLGKKTKTAEIIEDFKTKVREELIENDGKKGHTLSGTALMARVSGARERVADVRTIVGNKSDVLDDTVGTLLGVEAQYRVLLEEKLVEDLNYGQGSEEEAFVGSVLEDIIFEAKGGRFARGRARVNFDMTYEQMKQQVDREIKRRESSGAKVVTQGNMYKEAGMSAEAQQFMEMFKAGSTKIEDAGKMMEKVLAKAGTHFSEDLLEQIKSDTEGSPFAQELLARLERSGASASEKSAMKNFIDRIKGDETGIVEQQRNFERLMAGGQYGKAYRMLKAYITDVGPRENSSDFQFAAMLRNAKYSIGQINEDMGDEFDQWQSSLFVPSLKDINPEQANEVMPKVWNQGNVDHVLGQDFANAGAMSIELPDGTRKTWSAAAMYQKLQSTRNSMHLLNAEVNHVDGGMYKIFLEHMFGKGAHIDGDFILDSAGRRIMGMGDTLFVTDFELDAKGLAAGKLQVDTREATSLADIIKQSTWMNRRGSTFWMYSGEASEHIAQYPKEQLQNASKWAAAVDRMGHGYSLHFGKITGPYEQIAKVNHILPDLRIYKDTGTLNYTVRDTLLEAEEAMENTSMDKKKVRAFASTLTKKLEKQITVEGKTFTVGVHSLEEVRLIGNKYGSKEDAWDSAPEWLEAHGIPRSLIPTADQISRYEAEINGRTQDEFTKGLKNEQLQEAYEKFSWVDQQKEYWEMCRDLKWSKKRNIDIGGGVKISEEELMANIKAEELSPLAKRQANIMGTEWNPQNMDEFIQGFEFVSVMDPAKYLQGSDPVEFASKYRKLAMDVASKLPTLFSGRATAKEVIEINKLLRSYLPPEVVNDWWEAFSRIDIRANTNHLSTYEVAKVNPKNYVEILTRKITDENGNTYWLIGRDGHRIAEKEKYNELFNGSYSHHMWGRKTLRSSDVEVRYSALASEGMLPRPIMDGILDDVIGGGATLDKMLGITNASVSEKNKARLLLAKKVMARAYRLVKRFPLFDDPGWAMWSLSAEIINFAGEVGKEVVKDNMK
jgi:hypothetical protein